MGTHPIFESDFDCLTECDTQRLRNGYSRLAYFTWLPLASDF